MKAFVNSQSGYCFLVTMFHNRTLNNRKDAKDSALLQDIKFY